MEQRQQKTYSWSDGERVKKITFVQRETPEIDEKGLRRALTAKVYDKYTVKKLDRKSLENAMDTGAVDPMTVSRFVTMKSSKPYLKFSEGEAL